MSTLVHFSTRSLSGVLRRLSCLAGCIALPAIASADTYTFSTNSLKSMSHGTAYTWGLSPTANSKGTTLGSLEKSIQSGGARVQSATLYIAGMYDWIAEPADVLYVNLLNNLKPGVASVAYKSNVASYDTVFGKDVFNIVEKPQPLVAPVAPKKPTIKKPTEPKAPTLAMPTPPAPLGANPTQAQKNAYATAMANYQTKLTAYNNAQTKYTNDVATYNTNLGAYNTAQSQYATDKSAYDTALAAYNAALPGYKSALADYNNYTKAQTALGFDGVPVTAAGESIYDQAHSLLRADQPNGPGTWTDLDGPKTKDNLAIHFSDLNLQLLQELLTNASATTNIGLGFGPECHFYNKGMILEVTTKVPDTGATILMLGLGVGCIAGARRVTRRKVA